MEDETPEIIENPNIKVFRHKPTLVRALQFTGGEENAAEVIIWCEEHGHDARWHPPGVASDEAIEAMQLLARGGYQPNREIPEFIALDTRMGVQPVNIGFWLIEGRSGGVVAWPDDVLRDSYDPADIVDAEVVDEDPS